MTQQENKRRPTSVRLGPLTEKLLKDAYWYNLDSFPAWQVWADDVEAVLCFLQNEGRLDVFLKDIKSLQTPQHRDCEARGSSRCISFSSEWISNHSMGATRRRSNKG